MGSISRRLLVSVTLLLVLFFGVMVAVLDARFRTIADHALQDLLDAQIVALIASAEPDQAGNLIPRLQDAESQLATPGSGLYAGVQQADGAVIWRSPSAIGSLESFGPPQPLGHRSFHALQDARGQPLAAVSRGVEWEGEAGGAQRLTFSVAASLEGRDAQVRDFRRGLLGGFALLTAGLLVALALLLRWALQPLRRLARQIRQVEAGGRDQLDENWPSELTRVVANLNRLLQSERTRIARYRDTLGNLAHSLKTPLAVLRSSIREGSVPASVVDDQVERMSRIVEHQLRRAARSGAAGVGTASTPVLPVVQDLRATMLKVHREKDFALHLAVPAEVQFTGDRDDLLEALGNLMDNAAKWCRGQVRVSATVAEAGPHEQGLHLVVEDDGPGIAARDRQLVRERGARVDEQVPGHGLGLSMVGEMVDLYGGRLLIDDSPLGGARVELQLPGRLR